MHLPQYAAYHGQQQQQQQPHMPPQPSQFFMGGGVGGPLQPSPFMSPRATDLVLNPTGKSSEAAKPPTPLPKKTEIWGAPKLATTIRLLGCIL
jgi:hypothetical protein